MTRFIKTICYCLCCLAIFVSGCSSENDRTEDGRVIVHYWEKWTSFQADAMQQVVDDFNASQDRIFVKMLSVSSIDQKLMLATAGGNPPDVAGVWSHTINVFAENGALTPLNQYLEAANITRDDYIPVFWDLCGHRGYQWALPTTPATLALHWNKRLFKEADLDPNHPPQSIEELDRMAEQLTIVEVDRDNQTVQLSFADLTDAEKQSKDFKIIQLGHSPDIPGWFRELWGFWFGGSLWDGNNNITITSDENRRAFEWYRSYFEKYGLRNLREFGSSLGNHASPQDGFLSERVAMEIHGVWTYNYISRFAPHINWAAAPFPSFDPKANPDVTVVECDLLVIPAGAKNPSEAFEFIRYVNTRTAMEKLCTGHRKFSPLADVSDEFIDQHPNPYIEVFMNLAKSENARYVPRITIWNEYKDELLTGLDRIRSMDVSTEASLQEVSSRTQWKMDRTAKRWEMIRENRLSLWKRLAEAAKQ
ncbi:ABC transporter substrate-binding protein [Poriferisphaera sp. WC338]|uniref:ABC transporter substrate-binding protein n=1 Tax=Poriferisphaera sp. WC338 TaxID=3425129 RepID=UPI003D817C7F